MAAVPVALTIAGSDSGGGAGIQADLRTFSFHRVHGTSALTCVTAQNTLGVVRIDPLPAESVIEQLNVVVLDIGAQAVKTGMLLNRPIIEAVVEAVVERRLCSLVVDPVMVSRAGAQLIADDAIEALRNCLLPQALIVTPNCHEAEILSGLKVTDLDSMEQAARKISALGPKNVMIKGGGLAEPLRGADLWWDGCNAQVLRTRTIETPHTHGTGCTLSAAIAANLALGRQPFEAAQWAKEYVTQALDHALAIGQGQGPVGHFFPLLDASSEAN